MEKLIPKFQAVFRRRQRLRSPASESRRVKRPGASQQRCRFPAAGNGKPSARMAASGAVSFISLKTPTDHSAADVRWPELTDAVTSRAKFVARRRISRCSGPVRWAGTGIRSRLRSRMARGACVDMKNPSRMDAARIMRGARSLAADQGFFLDALLRWRRFSPPNGPPSDSAHECT